MHRGLCVQPCLGVCCPSSWPVLDPLPHLGLAWPKLNPLVCRPQSTEAPPHRARHLTTEPCEAGRVTPAPAPFQALGPPSHSMAPCGRAALSCQPCALEAEGAHCAQHFIDTFRPSGEICRVSRAWALPRAALGLPSPGRRKLLRGREAWWGPGGSFHQPGPSPTPRLGADSSPAASGEAKQSNTPEGTSLEGLRCRLLGPRG